MARLSAAERAKLPDRAFAYVDSDGKRRLPIYDESHVRNALARFGQVEFESERARDEARTRLLRAAKKFRIVPVGFINSQLRTERGAAPAVVDMPSGFVTMLMTDIEGSTPLLDRAGDRYAELLSTVREIHRAAVHRQCGHVVEARADEFFAAFESPPAAVESALAIHRDLAGYRWDGAEAVRVRMGVHSGYPTRSEANYIGMAVHTTARISDAAHGGQIVVSGDTRTALTGMTPDGVRFKKLGEYRLRGIPDEHHLYQLTAPGLSARFPPLRL
ncbi:MAG: adenylate/guanylate cyclase domain-containing protein [Ilumatobacter sp.]|nr:adenylate/guanylate cyclase domain-containing protein [Ilumatobacter sp.]